MAVFEHGLPVPGRGDACVEQHPAHGEQQQNDEEDLPVHGGDGHAVEDTAADQSAAQDQDVDADDAGQQPAAAVVGPLHHRNSRRRRHAVGIVLGCRHVSKRWRSGQMLDVLHLGGCLDVRHVVLRKVIWSLSAAGTNQEGVSHVSSVTNVKEVRSVLPLGLIVKMKLVRIPIFDIKHVPYFGRPLWI